MSRRRAVTYITLAGLSLLLQQQQQRRANLPAICCECSSLMLNYPSVTGTPLADISWNGLNFPTMGPKLPFLLILVLKSPGAIFMRRDSSHRYVSCAHRSGLWSYRSSPVRPLAQMSRTLKNLFFKWNMARRSPTRVNESI